MSELPDRLGRIEPLPCWVAACGLCSETAARVTYQEASIWLTGHLDARHKGWDEPTADGGAAVNRGRGR